MQGPIGAAGQSCLRGQVSTQLRAEVLSDWP